ncbi:IclR family transcriptional regulator domain-containing protein [Pigmentiphaga kullae]|uniref:IclR family transcriptional regulator n=1 Tax=Pigmentiphaga kullae TaxID=151784 RepID=A0A4Q7NHF8_9BURK|nr:helix-turn-helix domain-containing protein [Pigmentiphaga kullae]RZS84405.1 IclR family transcriptional regulator [Pigmentiphaga kullae]
METVPQACAPGQYKQVQGLLRGFDLLESLNECEGGKASPITLSEKTGIHRTTVKRLLETMRGAGYLRFLEESNEYCLTRRVHSLSEGYQDDSSIVDTIRPMMQALTRKLMWPSDLMMLDGDELVVRYTTHSLTQWSFNPKVLGVKVPLLRSAGGRAYIAFCSPTERRLLLKMLRERDGIDGLHSRDDTYMQNLIERYRSLGYALSASEEGESLKSLAFATNRCGAIAVPIRQKGVCVASLNVVYLRRAVSTREAVERYAPELMKVGEQIEKRL